MNYAFTRLTQFSTPSCKIYVLAIKLFGSNLSSDFDTLYWERYHLLSPVQVVLAAQRAFLFGQEGTTNSAFFNRLLSPVILQLSAELPEEMVEREINDGSLDAAKDAMGSAVVSALVQMGIRSGEEAMLKPLHHQVSHFMI